MSSLTPDETIIGLIAVQARHGYELLSCFRSTHQLGRVWNLSTSQIYAVLRRLEREGWIVGREIVSEKAPARTEYTLTESGEKRLFVWLNEADPPASIRRIRVEFFSRLYVARQLNVPTDTVVQHQRVACLSKYAELAAERENAEPGIDLLALELHISQLEAVLGWIERCELVPSERDNP